MARMQDCFWGRLISLHVHGVRGACSKSFIGFLGRHARTLRSLSLADCYVTHRQLARLSSLGLQLTSLEITCNEHDKPAAQEEADTGQILTYINNMGADCSVQWNIQPLSRVHTAVLQVVTRENTKPKIQDQNAAEGDDGDGDGAERKTMHVITHRDGRTAVGEEPLEYFSDWDSDDEGNRVVQCDQADF